MATKGSKPSEFKFDVRLEDEFTLDDKKQQEGVWVEIPMPEGKPLRFLIAHQDSDNKRFAREGERIYRRHQRAIDTKRMPAAQAEKIMLQTFCKTLLLDWDGINDSKGNPFPFSYENAIFFLTKFPRLYRRLKEHTEDEELFRQGTEEDEIDALKK